MLPQAALDQQHAAANDVSSLDGRPSTAGSNSNACRQPQAYQLEEAAAERATLQAELHAAVRKLEEADRQQVQLQQELHGAGSRQAGLQVGALG